MFLQPVRDCPLLNNYKIMQCLQPTGDENDHSNTHLPALNMIRLLLTLKFIVVLPLVTFAQWEGKVGLNFAPLIARSVEVTSEFSKNPAYSLNLNAGYTFGTGHIGLFDYKVYDGVEERKTSGAFAKLGGRVYLTKLKDNARKVDFFVGTSLIFSEYKQTAMKTEVSADLDMDFKPVESKGFVVCPSFSLGFTARVAEKIYIDWGVQKGFLSRNNDFIGRPGRNYQPGVGSGQASPFLGYIQGIAVVKYRL
jgi:hypothetical protein